MPIVHQCVLLELARSTAYHHYYQPASVSEGDLALMRQLDELHLEQSFLGSQRL